MSLDGIICTRGTYPHFLNVIPCHVNYSRKKNCILFVNCFTVICFRGNAFSNPYQVEYKIVS